MVPPDFPEWQRVMDMWGEKMLAAVTGVAALAAEGFGLPADAFTSRMQVRQSACVRAALVLVRRHATGSSSSSKSGDHQMTEAGQT